MHNVDWNHYHGFTLPSHKHPFTIIDYLHGGYKMSVRTVIGQIWNTYSFVFSPLFFFFFTLSFDLKPFNPLLFCSPTQLSFIFFQSIVPFLFVPPSLSAVTSSRKLPSAALWRAKPGFVDMVTEWWDGWGCRRGEGWAREDDRRTHAIKRIHIPLGGCAFFFFLFFTQRLSWILGHVTGIKRKATGCSFPVVCPCVGRTTECEGSQQKTWISFSLGRQSPTCVTNI